MSRKGDLEALKATYSGAFASLGEINSPQMWDFYMKHHREGEKENKTTQKRIRATLDLIPKEAFNVCDVGIGYGFVAERLQERFPRLSLAGIDISEVAIQRARQKLNGDFRIGPAERLPWRESSFDVVLLLETLEHVVPTKTLKVLDETKRVLKDDGVAVVSVPLYENLEMTTFRCPMCQALINPNGHVRSYIPELIISELKLAKFSIKEVKEIWPASPKTYLSQILSSFYPQRFRPVNLLIKCKKL